MKQHWNVQKNFLSLTEMPFYWRLSQFATSDEIIASRLPIRLTMNLEHNYLEFVPTTEEWRHIDAAYRRDHNIGFLNPESGQMGTYGKSFNEFVLKKIHTFKPSSIFEIGCGAGFTIEFLKNNGYFATGIDPSEYSKKWSEKNNFRLLNTFFNDDHADLNADFIYCNDVFEHIPNVARFSKNVYQALQANGVFCFSTTNSQRSIELGDISMLEHQHVNMFTYDSILSILHSVGFGEVTMEGGTYGNTFQVTARKCKSSATPAFEKNQCSLFFEKAKINLEKFSNFYSSFENCHYYVPLRAIPYLSAVGDFGLKAIYDSNFSWSSKYIDGYSRPIQGLQDIQFKNDHFFIGSLTFYDEIADSLRKKGYPPINIHSILTI
jgi:2-polyprenyl-3-methyl-5-hydroxy-6-metoxy-1,4-benzoquinol methylase